MLSLFSYGTLLPGLAPPGIAPVARKLRALQRGFVRGFLYDLGAFPGAVLSAGGGKVWGQIFSLDHDPEVLQRLDDYEGFDSAYPRRSQFVRVETVVFLASGGSVPAWMYEYNRDLGDAPRIADGDYGKFRGLKDRSRG